MATLRDLSIGDRFQYVDKFEHGWVREITGRKVGETILLWDVIETLSVRHHHPETGEEKFNITAPKVIVWDSRVAVIKQENPDG